MSTIYKTIDHTDAVCSETLSYFFDGSIILVSSTGNDFGKSSVIVSCLKKSKTAIRRMMLTCCLDLLFWWVHIETTTDNRNQSGFTGSSCVAE